MSTCQNRRVITTSLKGFRNEKNPGKVNIQNRIKEFNPYNSSRAGEGVNLLCFTNTFKRN